MKVSKKHRKSRRDSSSSSSSSSSKNSGSSSDTDSSSSTTTSSNGKSRAKRKRTASSSSSSDSSSTDSSTERKRRRKVLKRKLLKQQKKDAKAKKKALRKEKKAKRKQDKIDKKLAKKRLKEERQRAALVQVATSNHQQHQHTKSTAGRTPRRDGAQDVSLLDCGVPLDLMNRKARAPETKEEYEARQSIIRRVIDPETGRSRLIKGDGEVIEECVSRERHKDINRLATAVDGAEVQRKTIGFSVP